jgi:hypothetical protein
MPPRCFKKFVEPARDPPRAFVPKLIQPKLFTSHILKHHKDGQYGWGW